MTGLWFLNYVTDFADEAVVMPVVVTVALCLVITGWWRGARAWLIGAGGVLLSILLLKLAFLSCASEHALRSPSGHTAAAAVTCGGLVALLTGRLRWALAVSALAAAVIGGSRLALGVHTAPEVLVGALIGVGGAGATAWLAGPVPVFNRNWMAMSALTIVVLLHGMRMPAEAEIGHIANRLAIFLPICPLPDGQGHLALETR